MQQLVAWLPGKWCDVFITRLRRQNIVERSGDIQGWLSVAT